MKIFITFIFASCLSFCKAQTCICNRLPELSDFVDCKGITFSNNAKVYWQYNCDSSWFVFENKNIKKTIYSLEMIGLTGRIGYSYITEYTQTFLIQNRLISGCCQPPEFILFDKTTGREIENLGQLLFYSEDKNYPFVVNISDNFDYLIVTNFETHKKTKTSLPKDKIKASLHDLPEMYPEFLFENSAINNGVFTTTLTTKNPQKEDYKRQIIKINLNDKLK
jgi:hypothetical protein